MVARGRRVSSRAKPKVFMLIDTARIGGPGKGLFQFIRNADASRYDYVLCNFDHPQGSSEEFNAYARERRMPLLLLTQRFGWDPRCVWQAYRWIKQEGCTLVQSHGYKSHVVGLILSRMLKIPWLAWSHGWTLQDLKVRFYQALDRWTIRFADVAVAVSPPLYEQLTSWRGKERTTVLVLNAVESHAPVNSSISAEKIRERCGLGLDGQLIGCVGRLSLEKGQHELLQAFERIVQHHPHVVLLFVGEGPERAALRSLATEMKLAPRVCFHNYQVSLRAYYEALDLLVLPSLTEGLPNVVLEAMVRKVPVVASRVGAVPEILQDGQNGWMVPPGDIKALAHSCIQALRDRDRLEEIGKRGYESLYPKFSPQVRAEKILNLYDTLHR